MSDAIPVQTEDFPGCSEPFLVGSLIDNAICIRQKCGISSQAVHFIGTFKDQQDVHLKVLLKPVIVNKRGICAWSQIINPHLLKVYGGYPIAGHFVEFSEHVPGPSLAQIRRPMAASEILTMARGIAEALDTLHQAGFAHCDVSPGNLIKSTMRWILFDTGSLQELGRCMMHQPRKSLFQAPETHAEAYTVTADQDAYALAACLIYAAGIADNHADWLKLSAQASRAQLVERRGELMAVLDERTLRFCLALFTDAQTRSTTRAAQLLHPSVEIELPLELEYDCARLQKRLDQLLVRLILSRGAAILSLLPPACRSGCTSGEPRLIAAWITSIEQILAQPAPNSGPFLSNITLANIHQALAQGITAQMPDPGPWRYPPSALTDVIPDNEFYSIAETEFMQFCKLIEQQQAVRKEKNRQGWRRVGHWTGATVLAILGVIGAILAIALTLLFGFL